MLGDRTQVRKTWYDVWGPSARFQTRIPEDRIAELPRPLHQIRLPTFEFVPSRDGGAVRLDFGGRTDYTTFFGGSPDTDLILKEKEVSKLQHDFVHCVFSLTPEGTYDVGNGQTPDIVLMNQDGGVDAVEIKTISSDDVSEVLQRMNRALIHYDDLITKGLVNAINIVVVTPSNVYDLNGRLTTFGDEETANLVKNCTRSMKYGQQIYLGFKNRFGSRLNPEDLKSERQCVGMVSNMSFIDSAITKEFCLDKGSLLSEVKLGDDSFETKVETFDEYESRMRNVKGRPSGTSIIHVPMLIIEDGFSLIKSKSNGASVYEKIFDEAVNSMDHQHQSSYVELEYQSFANQEAKEESENSYDVVMVRVEPHDRIELASRGVGAKEMSKDPEIMRLKEHHHLPYNWDADMKHFDDFLDSDMTAMRPDARLLELLSHRHYDEDKIPDASKLFSMLITIKEAQALHNYMLIMTEVATNAKRHPKKGRNTMGFVCRRIWGKQAFVVLRNTSYATSNFQYCVFFRGESMIKNGLFEAVYEISGTDWKYCKFVNTDREKLSHTQGLFERQMSLWAMIAEQNMGNLHKEITFEQIASFFKTCRHSMMIDLEDNAALADTLQLFRFYYGELLSGKDDYMIKSQKITGKLPDYSRNLLSQFYLRRLFSIHKQLPKDMHIRLSKLITKVGKADDDMMMERAEDVLVEGVLTPFNFSARTAEEVVMCMYFSMLRNKDEGDEGYGTKAILEKLLKNEYDFLRLIGKKNPVDFHQTKETDPDKIGKFQFNRDAVTTGAKLLRDGIMRNAGYENHTEAEWEMYVDDLIGRKLSRTLMEDLGSTKASTIPFDPDVKILVASGKESKENQEEMINDVGRRRKVIFECLRLMEEGKVKDPIAAMNLEWVMKECKTMSDGLQVTIFKKNQITGTREIYVLTFAGRILMRVYNDVTRALCDVTDAEKLTDPKGKDSFVQEHYQRVKMFADKSGSIYTGTIRWSGDMTNWANLFSLFEQTAFMCDFYPRKYSAFFQNMSTLIRNKQIQIPREVVRNWIKSYQTYVETGELEHVKKLEAEFKAYADPSILRGPQKTVIRILTNMMQGIPHYPSSLYHAGHLELLKSMVINWAEGMGVSCVFSFELSSDDEGLIITFLSDKKELLHKAYKQFIKIWPRFKHTCDKYFGIRTSFEKSTLSVSDFFEFNSSFYIKNTLASALIKFVARSCDDQPEQSLHKRIATMYSSLRSCREAGATGFLCNFISIMQCVAFYRDLGWFNSSWLNRSILERVMPDALTFQGYYTIAHPFLAGIVGTEYMNWLSCTKTPQAKKIYSQIVASSVPTAEYKDMASDYAFNLNYGMFPRDKYLKELEKAGVKIDRDSEITNEEMSLFFRPLMDVNEVKRVLRFRACDAGIARSMAHLTRSDVVGMGAYALWASLFKINDLKQSLEGLRRKLLERDYPDVPITGLFPMNANFVYLEQVTSAEYRLMEIDGRRRTRYHWLSPHYQTDDHQEYVKKLLGSKWFGYSSGLSKRVENALWTRLQSDLPYLQERATMFGSLMTSDDPVARTLSHHACPAKTARELLGFIEAYAGSISPVKTLARGGTSAGLNVVDSLLRANTYAQCDVVPRESLIAPSRYAPDALTPSPEARRAMAAAQDRIKAWTEILYNMDSPSKKVMDYFNNDIRRAMGVVPDSMWLSQDASKKRSNILPKMLAFISGRIQYGKLLTIIDKVEFYTDLPMWSDGRFLGDYTKYIALEDGLIRADYKQERDEWTITTSLDKARISKMFRGRVVYKHQAMSSLGDLRPRSVILDKGALWVGVAEGRGNVIAYMAFPNVRAQSDHFNEKVPALGELVNLWLCRSKIDSKKMSALVKLTNSKDKDVAETSWAVFRHINTFTQNKMRIKLRERIEAANNYEEEFDVDKFMDDFKPSINLELLNSTTVEEMIEGDHELGIDYLESAVDDVSKWTTTLSTGMRIFSLESYQSTFMINAAARSLAMTIETMLTLDREMFSQDMLLFLEAYERMS